MAFGGLANDDVYCGSFLNTVAFRPPPAEGPWFSEEAGRAWDEYHLDFDEHIRMPRYRRELAQLKDGE